MSDKTITTREAILSGKFVLNIGRDTKGRLLAVITDGSQKDGDEEIIVLSVEIVKDSTEAQVWFQKQMEEMPWMQRQ